MGNHRLNAVVINIGRGLWICQHKLCVEKIQALIFHGARIEIGYRHDHEALQIEFKAIPLFIPKNRTL